MKTIGVKPLLPGESKEDAEADQSRASPTFLPMSTNDFPIRTMERVALSRFKWRDGRQSGLIQIVASWIVSPVLAGTISSILYITTDILVLRKASEIPNPVESGLLLLPCFYFVCLAANAFMVLYQGSPLLHFDDLTWWECTLISLAIGILAALGAQFLLKPRLRTRLAVIDVEAAEQNNTVDADITAARKTLELEESTGFVASMKRILPDRSRGPEGVRVLQIFITLQTFTACYAGFAHGANDVSNSIAPLAAIVALYKGDFSESEGVPLYVLLYGVLAICVGLWVLGYKVIRTVGTRMSTVTPASGFCIEFGSAMTVLIASKLGLPVSTTHCLVGSVVTVGALRSGKGVDWKLFSHVAASWVITLPAAGIAAAIIMELFKFDL